MNQWLKAPFSYFGGKSLVAGIVWERFGDVPNYVEPFFGSGAVLLNRPLWSEKVRWIETVNDADGMICNFWRAIQKDPRSVALHADWPVNECDLHARHAWLTARKLQLTERLMGDPDFHDPKIAGWWVWGMSCWIGGGFCSGDGPWVAQDGILTRSDQDDAPGIKRSRIQLFRYGQGIHRSNAYLRSYGQGVNELIPSDSPSDSLTGTRLIAWFAKLAARLRYVRVCCGDWTRVTGDTPTIFSANPCAVFLDPPYKLDIRDSQIYATESDCSALVRQWAIEHGQDPRFRIALCGFDNEHSMPDDWECVSWKRQGGYANQGHKRGRENSVKERIWFSPHCLKYGGLFAGIS